MNATVDVYALAVDITRFRRTQECNHIGCIVRLTEMAHRNIGIRDLARLEFRRRILSRALLGVGATWRDTIDGDAVLSDLARQALGPSGYAGLGGMGGSQAMRLQGTGNVDDSAPFAFSHPRQECMDQLARRREIQ